MGPPPRSPAANAHGCIMVRTRAGSTGYKLVARRSAPKGGLPPEPRASTRGQAVAAASNRHGRKYGADLQSLTPEAPYKRNAASCPFQVEDCHIRNHSPPITMKPANHSVNASATPAATQ